jgi:hypothetical protein
MVVIKKIKLEFVESILDDVVVLCSQIKVSQEELRYVEIKIEDNKNDFSAGKISKSLFKNKGTSFGKEDRKLKKKIKLNMKNSLRKIENLKTVFNEIEI